MLHPDISILICAEYNLVLMGAFELPPNNLLSHFSPYFKRMGVEER